MKLDEANTILLASQGAVGTDREREASAVLAAANAAYLASPYALPSGEPKPADGTPVLYSNRGNGYGLALIAYSDAYVVIDAPEYLNGAVFPIDDGDAAYHEAIDYFLSFGSVSDTVAGLVETANILDSFRAAGAVVDGEAPNVPDGPKPVDVTRVPTGSELVDETPEETRGRLDTPFSPASERERAAVRDIVDDELRLPFPSHVPLNVLVSDVRSAIDGAAGAEAVLRAALRLARVGLPFVLAFVLASPSLAARANGPDATLAPKPLPVYAPKPTPKPLPPRATPRRVN